jgi:hypothetical protein
MPVFASISRESLVESNSKTVTFIFIILVLICFVVLLRMGTSLLGWLLSPSENPILIDGMVDAKQMTIIKQDPSKKGSIPILRSNNEHHGLEFTWSVWLFIDDINYNINETDKHIFHKGSINSNTGTPYLLLSNNTNELIVGTNTFNKMNEEVRIKDIPLNKWVNVIIRINKQKFLDVYINGTMVKRQILTSVPKQNYGDVYTSVNGGFSGKISSLRYFSESIGTYKIQGIVDAGPNLKSVGNTIAYSKPRYLSTRWFFKQVSDDYS